MTTTDPTVHAVLPLVGRPREVGVEVLLASVGYRRGPLERARDALLLRLHRRSDDFEATQALRLVYATLARVVAASS